MRYLGMNVCEVSYRHPDREAGVVTAHRNRFPFALALMDVEEEVIQTDCCWRKRWHIFVIVCRVDRDISLASLGGFLCVAH